MNRHILFAILLVPMVAACAGRKVEDVSANPDYSFVMGKDFSTKQQSILYKYSEKERDVQLKIPGTTNVPELNELPGKFPYVYDGGVVLGVLPAGSRFRVVRAKRVTSSEMDYVYYEAEIISEGIFKGMTVNPTWLGTMGLVPKFKPDLVEEVAPAK